jgi:hypothetical protein
MSTALQRLRARAELARGQARIDELLAHPDPAAAVAALDAGEIHALVHEVGFDEAGELMAHVTAPQLQGCLDLDGWDRDRTTLSTWQPWIAALIATGYEHLGEVFAGLDPEARALLLQHHTIIHDLTLGEEPDDSDDRALYLTVDRFFAVRLTGDDDTSRLVVQLIDDLYRADADLARHTLQAARSELGAELEETAYRWRSGRLADLGYVAFDDALAIFAPLEASAVPEPEAAPELEHAPDDDHDAAALPLELAGEVLRRPRLVAALEHVDGAHAAGIASDLTVLVNKVLAAGRVTPGQRDAVARGAAYAAGTVSLGLELLAGADVHRAARFLVGTPIERLFRVGYTRTAQLARLAHALAPRCTTAGTPAAEVVTGLCATRPLLAGVLDTPPTPGFRPFDAVADLRNVGEVLARLTLRIALAEGLGVQVAALATLPPPHPGLDDHARTAIVRLLGGGAWTATALTQAEVAAARARGFDGGGLTAAARDRVSAQVASTLQAAGLGAHAAGAARLADQLADDVEAALGELGDGPVDARFVDGLLIGG